MSEPDETPHDVLSIEVVERFVKCPVQAMTDQRLSDCALRVYLAIRSHIDESKSDGVAFPGRKRLAEMLGKSIKTIGRAINELVELGYISITKVPRRNGRWPHNRYTIHHGADLSDHGTDLSHHHGTDLSDHHGTDLSPEVRIKNQSDPVEPDTREVKPTVTAGREATAASSGDPFFEEIWPTWPNQQSGRQPAYNAWRRTTREHAARKNDIIAACIAYRDHQAGNDFAVGLPRFLGNQYALGDWVDWVDGVPDTAPTSHLEVEKEVLTMEDLIAAENNETGTT